MDLQLQKQRWSEEVADWLTAQAGHWSPAVPDYLALLLCVLVGVGAAVTDGLADRSMKETLLPQL